jgi:serine/threonine protein kinase/tetratricopeptide (TPR) repeat protein
VFVPPDFAEALQERYTLERELGRGGMATVYLAIDRKHKRPVALKVLRPELALSLGPERFRREIEIAARLQHPHILTVHDSGETRGTRGAGPWLWFTMPYVEGESLRDRLLRQKQLPMEDGLRITREVLQALEYAHQHGIVHRDIKPENILLGPDGSTLVSDFGIARALNAADDRLTSAGLAVGTPAYMSPEQAGGDQDVGPASDLYSLACVLYEMLVGQPPFTGPTPQAILARRLSGMPPTLRAVRPTVPATVENALTRALSPVPADRFGSAADFARALSGIGVGSEPRATQVTPASRGRRSRARALGLAALGLVAIATGVVLQRGYRPKEVGPGTPVRIAVLPFENLSRAEDEYFVDGLTDEVRGRLADVPALSVIARTSSNEYRRTTKTPGQIGKELGVQYLLGGTVRWDKADGVSRVRISPELVRASDASTRWRRSFDAPMTDLFSMQGQVASQVAQALELALGAKAARRLDEKPTASLAAYELFLRAGAAALEFTGAQRASTLYQEAVALDSTFALAWAQLARVRARLYTTARFTDVAAARMAADRAVALAPERAEGYIALGDFHYYVTRDHLHALAAYEQGLKLAPANAELLTALAITEQSLGRWETSLGHLQQAFELDPRSIEVAYQIELSLARLRRYPEAMRAADRALALAPDHIPSIQEKLSVYLAQGDLAGARAVIDAVPSTVSHADLFVNMALFMDLYWVLDDAQQRVLLQLPPSAFGNERAIWAMVRAEVYHLRGERATARVYADTARQEYEAQLRSAPGDAQRLVLLGLMLAYLGRNAEAVAAGERAVSLLPISADAGMGAYVQHQLVRTYLLVGEPEKALDRLEPLLRIPYDLSPGLLRIDPNFDPLRKNPRFQRLAEGSTNR